MYYATKKGVDGAVDRWDDSFPRI